jgi:hypothetical protein
MLPPFISQTKPLKQGCQFQRPERGRCMQSLSHSRIATCTRKERFPLDILRGCYSEGQLEPPTRGLQLTAVSSANARGSFQAATTANQSTTAKDPADVDQARDPASLSRSLAASSLRYVVAVFYCFLPRANLSQPTFIDDLEHWCAAILESFLA